MKGVMFSREAATFSREAVTFSREAVTFFCKAVTFSREAVTFYLSLLTSHFSPLMKSMSKSELAVRTGVSLNTLSRWFKPFQEELAAMGMQHYQKVLPPHIVKYLAEKLCIDK